MLPQSDSTFSHELCTNIVSIKYSYLIKRFPKSRNAYITYVKIDKMYDN